MPWQHATAFYWFNLILLVGTWGRDLSVFTKVIVRALALSLMLECLGGGMGLAANVPTTNGVCIASLSPADADEFATLVKAKDNRADEVHVLTRLLAEKRAEVQTIADQLRRNFNVQPDRVYIYEPESQTIYAVVSNAVPGVKTGQVDRVVHKQLSSADVVNAFTRLVTAKQLAEQLVRALDLLMREKQIAWERTDNELHARFKLNATQAYRLDLQTRQVFALPVQGSNVVMAAKAATKTK